MTFAPSVANTVEGVTGCTFSAKIPVANRPAFAGVQVAAELSVRKIPAPPREPA
jgi:hypothetical protein